MKNKEIGLFRTKLFGGFNKKDVLEYYESLTEQLKNENGDTEIKNKALTEELDKKSAQVKELLEKNDAYSDKISQLEAKIDLLSSDNEKLSKNFLKMKSDYIAKASQLKKTETDYATLKNAVADLPKIDKNLIENSLDSVRILEHLVEATAKFSDSAKLLRGED